MNIACLRFCILCALLGSTPAFAAVTVGSGSSVDFADGTLGLGCSDLIVAGQASGSASNVGAIANLSIAAGGALAPGASHITLGGNFADAGAFTPGTSQISIVDACGSSVSAVSGATNFYDLIVGTTTGKQLVLAAGNAQSVTHALTLQGAAGQLLQILSSVAGQQALLNLSASATQAIAYVNARDNKASGATIAPGTAASHSSVDSGNLVNWFANAIADPNVAAIPAPLLDDYGCAWLAVLLALAAWFGLSRRATGMPPGWTKLR